jgi:hypothetical protein
LEGGGDEKGVKDGFEVLERQALVTCLIAGSDI